MKKSLLFFSLASLLLIHSGCNQKNKNIDSSEPETFKIDTVTKWDFQEIINSKNLKGAIVIYDSHSKTYFSNDFKWAKKGQLPASTFKIPNSIIALELGIIQDTTSILFWDGKPQMNSKWEQDLKLKDALQLSCVPCYREIARQIGLNRMISYTKSFNYGEMIIDSSNLDLFWLMGDSKINSFEQIDFLQHFNEQKLDIKPSTFETMQYILLREETDLYKLYGKTGWSNDNNHDNTWFVGFVETKGNTFYFATNLEPTENSNINELAKYRITLTKKAFKLIGVHLNED